MNERDEKTLRKQVAKTFTEAQKQLKKLLGHGNDELVIFEIFCGALRLIARIDLVLTGRLAKVIWKRYYNNGKPNNGKGE